ncbi:DUF3341 domain-containing protein [Salibacteraceae bacterium]|jgi:hypothetical protein|nr:DUF3341 domain-containing protein [Salibacteraceae bacterium]
MAGKTIFGMYDDDGTLMTGAAALIDKGLHIKDAYTPFPVHGLDRVLGVKWTRLAQCAFIYGLIGAILALSGFWFFMISDWPMNIGGKPNGVLYENLPAFIPITFEFTVLCAAHGMAITYLLRNWTLPGVKARNPHPRTTDDHFCIEISTEENNNFSEEDINSLLKETGTVEIFERA